MWSIVVRPDLVVALDPAVGSRVEVRPRPHRGPLFLDDVDGPAPDSSGVLAAEARVEHCFEFAADLADRNSPVVRVGRGSL